MEENYGASSIQVLEGLEAVRKRPAMYIGDVNERGLHHLISEVVDNSIDEAMAGYCSKIEVSLNADGSVTVQDNGRGIPVDMHPKEKRSALEVVMTVLHAGGKFNKDSYKVSGGLHGVGVSCVNALSTKLIVEVRREGKLYMQEYEKGKPLYPVKEVGTAEGTGTKVTWWADGTVFITEGWKSATEPAYKYDTIASRLRELAFLNAGIHITFTDYREALEDGSYRQDVFYSEKGLVEYVHYLDESRTPLISDVISFSTEQEGTPIDVAFIYNKDYSENVYSYVNNINTHEGGTHVIGFRNALSYIICKYAEEGKVLEKAKLKDKDGKSLISPEDYREGLTAVISVKVAEPQFEGQTKTKLGNAEIRNRVYEAVKNAVEHYLETNKEDRDRIIEKIVLAAQARIAARNARLNVQRKSPLSGGGLPGKLADCSSKIAEECELFLVEGDSAGGTAKNGRDRATQAILPLRGKILNVEKAQPHKAYESEEIRNIYTALGVTFNEDKTLNLSKLRYHKVIIMTDADVDGSHIATLILTFFFRYMRDLIEGGHVYIATPPLYLCSKGKIKEYCWNEEQRQAFIEKYGAGSEGGIHTQRYKGLGEMSEEQLRDTTMSKENRILRQVTLENAAEADHIFSMLMGDDVEPRRLFIEQNATYANIDA